MKKKILVISQYFYPEQFRINDICAEWVKRGHEVKVITGIPNYPKGKFFEGYGLLKRRKETISGIEVLRLPIIPRGKNPIVLIMNYLSFVVSGFFWHLTEPMKADLIFVFEVSPMTQALPAVWYSKRNKVPMHLYVQDLWPENVEVVAGIHNKGIIRAIGIMVDYIYRYAKVIYAPSGSFIKAIGDRGVPSLKLEFLPQFAEDIYIPLGKQEIKGIDPLSFNLTYAGNIGKAQGLDILITAAKHLLLSHKEKKIKFNLIGGGRYLSDYKELVKQSQLEDYFNFIPMQKPEVIPRYLAASEAVVLCLMDNPLFNMTIPAKLQTYLACGKPILAGASGETKSIIEAARCGFVTKPGDGEAFAKSVLELYGLDHQELEAMGVRAYDHYHKNFEKEKIMNRLEHVMDKELNEEGRVDVQ